MSGWVLRQFSGLAPRLAPRLLADNQAQVANNITLKRGILTPLKGNLYIGTLPKSGQIKTIHRFGQSVAADGQFWFHWAADVDVVRGPVAGDTQERTYYTDGVLPKVTDNSIALAGGASYPMASYTLGVPYPSSAPMAVVGGTPEANALAEERLYIVTFVTGWGEQGAPSDASLPVNVTVGETVSLTLPAVPGGSYNIVAKRIWRSVPGSLGTPYLFVAEVAAATASYVDAKRADELGEELPSLDYEMPPSGLLGLTSGPNGVMGGFVGKDVYFCEPFKPYAWPGQYSMTVDADVVGLAVFDTTWLVLTKSNPYLIQGADPSAYSMVKADIPQACVSKRSIAEAPGGVIFASPDGLFLVGGGVTRNLTESYMTQAEWSAWQPATLHGYVVDNCYVGFYGNSAGFIFDLSTGMLTGLDWYASAGYYDPIRDALFLVTGNNQLVKFNAGANSVITWHSKPFYSPRAINLGAARVEASAFPVTFRCYADGAFKHVQTVADSQPFRLPGGFLANQWEFELSGTAEIYSVAAAEGLSELMNG